MLRQPNKGVIPGENVDESTVGHFDVGESAESDSAHFYAGESESDESETD